MERTVLNQKRCDRTSGLVEPRFEHAALAGAVRVCLELQHFCGQKDGLEQIVDALAGLCGDLADLGLAAPVGRRQTVLGQLGENAVRVCPVLIHLVDGNDDGDVRRLRVVDCFDRLRHDAVVGGDHENGNVGAHRAARAHFGECCVTRGVEEGDGLVADLHGVSADVLGDAACFAGCDLCMADIVKKRGLAVVDVTHDDDDRGTGDQLVCCVLVVVKELFFNRDDDLALNLAAELHGDKLCGVVVDGLVDGRHHAVFQQALDDLCGGFLHARGKLADGNLVRNLDDQRRLFGNFELKPAHLLLLLGAVLGAELLCLLLFVLVADFLLAARVVLHALGDQRIDAVVVAVGVDGDGAGINDAALTLALGLRLLCRLLCIVLRILALGRLLLRLGLLRTRLLILRLRALVKLRALILLLRRAVIIVVEASLRTGLILLRTRRGLLALDRLALLRCGCGGLRLVLRLCCGEDLGNRADLVLRGDIVKNYVQLLFRQILRAALGLIIKLSDNFNEVLGGHPKIVCYLFDFLLDLNTHTATSITFYQISRFSGVPFLPGGVSARARSAASAPVKSPHAAAPAPAGPPETPLQTARPELRTARRRCSPVRPPARPS